MKYIVTRQVLPYDAISLDLGHGGLGQLGLFGSPLEKVPNNCNKVYQINCTVLALHYIALWFALAEVRWESWWQGSSQRHHTVIGNKCHHHGHHRYFLVFSPSCALVELRTVHCSTLHHCVITWQCNVKQVSCSFQSGPQSWVFLRCRTSLKR